MKVGIIGLGNIAEKAYLPITCNDENITPVFCTRNGKKLEQLAKRYRVSEFTKNLDELMTKNIEAAFVHAATSAHYKIVKKLLENGIHVYVDKPLSYSLNESEELTKIANENKKILFVGFNRRHAPMYKEIYNQAKPEIIIMQKNRVNTPGDLREFVLDDFIHVIDTVRYLSKTAIEDLSVNFIKSGNQFSTIAVQMFGKNFSAYALMNRDNGLTEEKLEVMQSGKKWSANDLNSISFFENDNIKISNFNDWDSTLYRRGFNGIINEFINLVKSGFLKSNAEDALITHNLCERIIEKINIAL